VVLARLPLISLALERVGDVIVLVAIRLRAEGVVFRPVVPQLLSDALHVLDLVRTRVRSRPDRLVVLDAEVDPCD